MRSKRKHLRVVKSSISDKLFHEIEAVRYSNEISRSALIRMILEKKVSELIRLLGPKAIDEF